VDEMRKLKKNGSAQILILVALAIASIIVSTEVYVFQLSQVSSAGDPFSPQDFVRNVKLGSRNLMIGLLANISHGGESETLETSLERWASFVENKYYFGESSLRFALCGTAPYSSGLWVFWGEGGFGVTGTEADFSMNLTSTGTEMNVAYSVSVTTSLSVYGTLTRLAGEQRVDVTILLFNEEKPALAKNLTVNYESRTGWMNAGLLDSYRLQDFGNGTYRASFIVERQPHLRISVECHDRREIFVQANATCTDA